MIDINFYSYEVENNDFYFALTLALLPLLWLVGILPPVDSIFPWALETVRTLTVVLLVY